MERICIYTKDVQRLLGRSERYSRDLLSKIKKVNNKKDHQIVTIEEFCHYVGVPIDKVLMILQKFG
jgi:hypothetical protein